MSDSSYLGTGADVEKGDNLSVALSRKPIFPPMLLRMVAAGEADLYPRLGPTMEWDTAAGQAVVGSAESASK